MQSKIDGILFIHRSTIYSPNLDIKLIKDNLKILQLNNINELLTCDENYNQYNDHMEQYIKRIQKIQYE